MHRRSTNISFPLLIALLAILMFSPWSLVSSMHAFFASPFLSYRSECIVLPSAAKARQVSFARMHRLLISRAVSLNGKIKSGSYLLPDHCTRLSQVIIAARKESFSTPIIPAFRLIPLPEEEELPALA